MPIHAIAVPRKARLVGSGVFTAAPFARKPVVRPHRLSCRGPHTPIYGWQRRRYFEMPFGVSTSFGVAQVPLVLLITKLIEFIAFLKSSESSIVRLSVPKPSTFFAPKLRSEGGSKVALKGVRLIDPMVNEAAFTLTSTDPPPPIRKLSVPLSTEVDVAVAVAEVVRLASTGA